MLCTRCHRQLRNAPVMLDGFAFGPKCAKAAEPVASHERDLFGYSPELAARAASERIRIHIEVLTVDALMAVKREFAAARRRAGVLA